MNDTIEILLELTQREADLIAGTLRSGYCWDKTDAALLKRVARKFQCATEDATSKEMYGKEIEPDPDGGKSDV